MLTEAGFKQGLYSAYGFYHEPTNIRVVVHGDDFAVPNSAEDGVEVQGQIGERRAMSSEDLEQDRDGDGGRGRV